MKTCMDGMRDLVEKEMEMIKGMSELIHFFVFRLSPWKECFISAEAGFN